MEILYNFISIVVEFRLFDFMVGGRRRGRGVVDGSTEKSKSNTVKSRLKID